MAKVFADASGDVTIHARRPEVVAEINVRHQNARYLPDVVLPGRLRATVDPVEALAGARHVASLGVDRHGSLAGTMTVQLSRVCLWLLGARQMSQTEAVSQSSTWRRIRAGRISSG